MVLVIGNGTPSARRNAFEAYQNGSLGIAGNLTQNSDARLKKDIAPLDAVLARLESVRGVTYAFQDPASYPAGRHIGLLAQEVREAFPELVTESSDGTLAVAYGNFTAVLLEAVKEQQREISALRERLAQLELRSSEGR